MRTIIRVKQQLLHILKYIQDALVHLKDKDTYLIISEEEALLEDSDLRSEIKKWRQTNHIVLRRMTRDYISSKLAGTSTDPFRLFYIFVQAQQEPYYNKACVFWL